VIEETVGTTLKLARAIWVPSTPASGSALRKITLPSSVHDGFAARPATVEPAMTVCALGALSLKTTICVPS
jgi:hypothetical protein